VRTASVSERLSQISFVPVDTRRAFQQHAWPAARASPSSGDSHLYAAIEPGKIKAAIAPDYARTISRLAALAPGQLLEFHHLWSLQVLHARHW
jgi:hypothetical protein